jgi:hypothetical protein
MAAPAILLGKVLLAEMPRGRATPPAPESSDGGHWNMGGYELIAASFLIVIDAGRPRHTFQVCLTCASTARFQRGNHIPEWAC